MSSLPAARPALQDVAQTSRRERTQIAAVGHEAVGVGLQLLEQPPVAGIGQPVGQARAAFGVGDGDPPVQAGDEVRVDHRRGAGCRRRHALVQVEPFEPPRARRRGMELHHLPVRPAAGSLRVRSGSLPLRRYPNLASRGPKLPGTCANVAAGVRLHCGAGSSSKEDRHDHPTDARTGLTAKTRSRRNSNPSCRTGTTRTAGSDAGIGPAAGRGRLMVINAVGHLAEAAWHHPDITASYAFVIVKLMNHAAKGVTDKDFELARRIEEFVHWQPGRRQRAGGNTEGPEVPLRQVRLNERAHPRSSPAASRTTACAGRSRGSRTGTSPGACTSSGCRSRA